VFVLALDASTYAGSVALIRDGAVLADAVVAMRGQREERLMPAIADLLARVGVAVAELDAVACGSGPGSFTSLRIAASIAKGLAVARGIPLLAAPSTLLVTAGAEPPLAAGRYVAALDAMRGDWFCHQVDVSSVSHLKAGRAWRARRDELESFASAAGAEIVGPAEAPPREPGARGFAVLIVQGLAREVDVASWEPDYGRKAEAQVRWEALHGRELVDER
jgi:tRNA threonylcarbamoyladenosine biosynthesis protein TsaB